MHERVHIIAGPCSVNRENVHELYELSEMRVNGQRAISAVRCVGLKSRTEHAGTNKDLGMDLEVIEQAILTGVNVEVPPSVLIAQELSLKTSIGIATEIMDPGIQMPHYVNRISAGRLMPWQPSTQQLGWEVMIMAKTAAENGWTVGLKNGKWEDMARAWMGLATYARHVGAKVNFIHRGIDIATKGDYRGALVHNVVRELAITIPDAGRLFDPSHSLGPNLRDQIAEASIEALMMKVGDEYLYDGLLIEAGTSNTDSKQHVTHEELLHIATEVSRYRPLRGPWGLV